MNSFYSEKELKDLGFSSCGDNVLISKKCSIYGAKEMIIGNNVRIDDFCILSGNITIGDYVHISAYVALYAKSGLKIGNFCGISPRSTIYTISDDFSGEYMVGPMVPSHLSNVQSKEVVLKDYVQLGANTIVMPGITIGEGAATGAFSLVLKDIDDWTINFGIPSKYYKPRKKNILQLTNEVLQK